jgi:hypothetical protein
MRYYLHYGHSNMTKNNLDKAAAGLFKSLDGVLVGEDRIDSFKAGLMLSIDRINNENKRCKSIELGFTTNAGKGVIIITGVHCLNLFLYPVNGDY